ncbi:hypothetical protein HYC85_010577 [Camellia sinensis]|uniref:Uncharacterized protein n=1 Tax=Camellia sinensis TaxID=4442 RepID=A0A7J7HIG0_CAMSI|nr:hypothetical protein HYC85_010577 [Camellia sinensis]
MKRKIGGEVTATDALQLPLRPPVGGGEAADGKAAHGGDDEATVAEEQRLEEGGEEGGEDGEEEEEEEEEEEGEEKGEKGYDKFDHLEIDDDGEADDTERPKLEEDFYEIEAVRKKRVRKEARIRIRIRIRDTDTIRYGYGDTTKFEKLGYGYGGDTLQSGNHRSSRRRKRKHGVTHTQPKKKQRTSPAAATYNVPAVKVRIIEEPLPMVPLDVSSLANGGERYLWAASNVESSKQTKESGFGAVPTQIEEMEDQNELNLKLSELRGTMATYEEDVNKCSVRYQEAHDLEGDGSANGLSKVDCVKQVQPGRFTGAKRRKSGSVQRHIEELSDTLLGVSIVLMLCYVDRSGTWNGNVNMVKIFGSNQDKMGQTRVKRKLIAGRLRRMTSSLVVEQALSIGREGSRRELVVIFMMEK